jgi:hypothetical protein
MLAAATLQHEPVKVKLTCLIRYHTMMEMKTHQISFGYKAGWAPDQSWIMVVKNKALPLLGINLVVQSLACPID